MLNLNCVASVISLCTNFIVSGNLIGSFVFLCPDSDEPVSSFCVTSSSVLFCRRPSPAPCPTRPHLQHRPWLAPFLLPSSALLNLRLSSLPLEAAITALPWLSRCLPAASSSGPLSSSLLLFAANCLPLRRTAAAASAATYRAPWLSIAPLPCELILVA